MVSATRFDLLTFAAIAGLVTLTCDYTTAGEPDSKNMAISHE